MRRSPIAASSRSARAHTASTCTSTPRTWSACSMRTSRTSPNRGRAPDLVHLDPTVVDLTYEDALALGERRRLAPGEADHRALHERRVRDGEPDPALGDGRE